MSLQSKAYLLAELKPTVAILPESAHPDRVGYALKAIGATSTQWIGANPNKGLLAVAFGGWTLRLDADYDPGYQWVMPLHLDGPRHIRVLAVWDMNHRGRGHQSARRLGACRASMQRYDEFLSGESDLTVISGDFNNSVYWDKPTSRIKFGDFMNQLESRGGYVSAYHLYYGCERGAEPQPTLWWMRNSTKAYHVDYTFVSDPGAIEAVTLGRHTDWIAHSDHSPMTVDLRVLPRLETCADMVADDESVTTEGGKADAEDHPLGKEVHMTKNHFMRFQLEPSDLDDMTCGVNGVKQVRKFRPSYFTAEWRDGALAEVRVWGPQVLKDGSLGNRELDHVWKKTQATGPLKYTDLPPLVARRLRAYNVENCSKALLEQL